MSSIGRWVLLVFVLIVVMQTAACWRYVNLYVYVIEKQRADHLARISALLADAAKGKVDSHDLIHDTWQVELSDAYEDQAVSSPVHHFRYARVDELTDVVETRLRRMGATTTTGLLTFGFDEEDLLVEMTWSSS